MVAQTVRQFATAGTRRRGAARVLSGEIRLCLGYTEPEGGSDIATCKTRAVRDGDDWVINGSKMFTSNAHNAHYVFLITNTDPDAPKHKSLTMFLVPLDLAGRRDPGHPHRRRRPHQHHLLQRRPRRRQVPHRRGQRRLGGAAGGAGRRARHRRTRRQRTAQDRRDDRTHHPDGRGGRPDRRVGPPAPMAPLDRRQSVSYRLGRGIARMEAAHEHPGDVRPGRHRADDARRRRRI